MKIVKHIFYSLILIQLLVSCANQVNNNTNYAHLYNGKSATVKPEYIVYHNSKKETELYFRINSNDVLYARKDKSQPYFAKISIHYELFGLESKKLILDSATTKIVDETVKKNPKYLTGKIKIKTEFGKDYILRITATDLNRNNSNDQEISLNKSNVNHPQFFLVKEKETGQLIYQNYINKSILVDIISEENVGKQIHIQRFYRDFPIAAPPFSSTNTKKFDYKPNEHLQQIIPKEGTFSCVLPDSGFIHLQLDTSKKEGVTYFGFKDNFPRIKNIYGMIDPLRYISSNAEFEKLQKSEETKKAVDEFWLTKCGTEERAREIIRKYYNRVQDANNVFTSYVEGWKTDRGMVSLIYGSPKTVRKARDEEVWYYGEENNALALQFTFIKVDNPFSDNDYKLLRTQGYKSSWYRAVDAWRSGRVYWAQ